MKVPSIALLILDNISLFKDNIASYFKIKYTLNNKKSLKTIHKLL